jgi:signal transduction histidine kinase
LLQTLTSKFTFFFWFVFSIIVIPIYFFGTVYIKNIFQDIESQKVQLMVKTLKPSLALNISFEQEKQLDTLLHTILKEENIKEVSLQSAKFTQKISKKRFANSKILHYHSSIKDPFSKKSIAKIDIAYSNENAILLYNKIEKYLLFIFIFALFTFLAFYFFIKKELNALKYIASSLQHYSEEKKVYSIKIENTTQEIQTISTVANEMMQNLSKYFLQLQSFNSELEKKVEKKVKKLHEQEKIMIHQSRQAAMGEMIESIAHQWRQPLNIIGLACVNLETEHQLGILKDENFENKMQIIAKNIDYMSNTIDDFRNFLNPDKELLLFNPKQTIEDVLKLLQEQLKNNKITLHIHEKDTLEMCGIENEFKQVLFVLINNAKDAIKSKKNNENTPQGQIDVTLMKKDGKNIISFCDNGGGIKDEIIHSIFNPYFSTKFAASGTGIGLYIAKNIIESRMGGQLYVKNIKKGCCFYIEQITKEKIDENHTSTLS